MNGTRPSSLVPYNNNAAMRIKSVQDSPQFRFRLWGFSGVVFLSVIYPSLFFSFVFTVPFFLIFSYDELSGSSHTDRLTFFVCLFWFIRRVLSSDATVADLAIFSEKEERPTPKIEEFKHIYRNNEAFLRCRIVPYPFSFAGLDSGPTAAAAAAESPHAIDAHQFPGPH